MKSEAPTPVSFRDPAGRLLFLSERVLRVVNSAGVPNLTAFLGSPAGRKVIAAGAVVGTRVLAESELRLLRDDAVVDALVESASGGVVVEHDRVAFPSFPYEWSPEMLHAAALLTLDLVQELLPDGVGLKDATPYNVLFRGPNAVFVDLLSFEKRDPGDPAWTPYAQFVRTFVLPLLVNRFYGQKLDQLLLARRDGIEPEEVYRSAGPLRRLAPPFLSLVSIPVWLGRRHSPDDSAIYEQRRRRCPEEARFVLTALLNGLRRSLRKLTPAEGQRSTWSDYMAANNNYSSEHFASKKDFVERAMRTLSPCRVLDVGCNNGFFSSIAAGSGASVVAIDADPVVVGQTWRRARAQSLDILPLVVNLARPTPAVGWLNRECASFLDRARGRFDAVMMLAVLHHLLVTERVPLEDVVSLAAELTTDALIIEFIAPQDSMFKRLTRGRDSLHADLTVSRFEAAFQARFDIDRVAHVEGTFRSLYLFHKRSR